MTVVIKQGTIITAAVAVARRAAANSKLIIKWPKTIELTTRTNNTRNIGNNALLREVN